MAAGPPERELTFPQFLAKAKEACATALWRGSVDEQQAYIDKLNQFKHHIPDLDFEAVCDIVREGLGLTGDTGVARFSHIMALERTKDLRRALKFHFVKPSGHVRLPDEEIYPKDESWLASYLLFAQATEVPLAWHFWVSLAVIGAATRRNIYIDKNMFEIYSNLYLILIGDTATKKSTAMNIGIDILNRINRLLEHGYKSKQVPEHRMIYIAPQKCTPERFINKVKSVTVAEENELGEQENLDSESVAVLYGDELVHLFGKESYGSGPWIGNLTTWASCPEIFDCSTITRQDEVMRNVHITLLGGSTMDWIRSSITEDMFGGGFMGRCLFIPRGDSGRSFPEPGILDPIAADDLARFLVPYTQMPVTEFARGHEWVEWFGDWYRTQYQHNERRAMGDPKMKGYYGRKATQMEKVGMLIALGHGRTSGELEDIQLAKVVMEHEEKLLPTTFSEMTAHPDSVILDKILNVLKRSGTMSKGRLFRRLRNDIPTTKMFHLFTDSLVAQDKIERKYDKEIGGTYFTLKRSSGTRTEEEDEDL